MYLYNTLNSNLAYSNRVAQSAPKSKNLPGHQSYLCLLPNCWEKCIETPKKLMPRVCKKLPHLGPHLPYVFQWENAIFWSRSFLTPLIAWKTPTNIRKQLWMEQIGRNWEKKSKKWFFRQNFMPSRSLQSAKIWSMSSILVLFGCLVGYWDMQSCFPMFVRVFQAIRGVKNDLDENMTFLP